MKKKIVLSKQSGTAVVGWTVCLLLSPHVPLCCLCVCVYSLSLSVCISVCLSLFPFLTSACIPGWRRTITYVKGKLDFVKNIPVDHIFTLTAIVQKYLNKRGAKMYVAFVDFRKAFDSVRHYDLLAALRKEVVSGKCAGDIRAMYNSLLSCVRVNGELTDFFDCPMV